MPDLEVDNKALEHEFDLKEPNPLPTNNVTLQEFLSWRLNIIAYLENVEEWRPFLPGHLYSTWTEETQPSHENPGGCDRIKHLHPEDPGYLQADKTSSYQLKYLLSLKNDQLEKMIQFILKSSHCHGEGYWALFRKACNVDEIFELVMGAHDLGEKPKASVDNNVEVPTVQELSAGTQEPSHAEEVLARTQEPSRVEEFSALQEPSRVQEPPATDIGAALSSIGSIFELCETEYQESEEFNAFYTRFRSVISQHLKKKNEKIMESSDLSQVEIFSPTFEDVILLWCLEKIDHEAPKLVKQAFSSRLGDDVRCLRDLEVEIFQYLTESHKNGELVRNQFLPGEKFPIIKEEITQEDVTAFDHFDDVDSKKVTKAQLLGSLKSEFEQNGLDAALDDLMDVDDGGGSDYEGGEGEEEEGDSENDEDFDFLPTKSEVKIKHETQHANAKIKKDGIKTEKLGNVSIKDGGLPCPQCDKVLANRRNLKRHLLTHVSPKKRGRVPKPLDELVEKKRKIPIPVMCDLCGKVLRGQRRLREHKERKHNKDRMYTCKKCSEPFKGLEALKAHMEEMHPKEPKQETRICPECGKVVHSHSLQRHMLIHNSNFICKLCCKRFMSQELFENHMKRHDSDPSYGRKIKPRPYHCNTCNRSFVSEDEFNSHVCKHFPCDMCDMKFLNERNMKMHKRVHSGETLYSCEQCESMFPTRKGLRVHNRNTHDPNQRKHKCPECGKGFLSRSGLERHTLTHTEIRPYKCDKCESAFRQKSALDSHIMHKHTKDRPYSCDVCHMRFQGLTLLKKHKEVNKCGIKKDDHMKAEIPIES